MSIWRLVWKEICYRKAGFSLATGSVAIAMGCLVGSLALLDIHDVRTRQILDARKAETKQKMAELEDSMRKAMLNLGFNIVILPKDQRLDDWYTDDAASSYMPQEYIGLLERSKIVTIQHLLPCLQQKVKWPETRRTIILVGTTGETPGSTTKNALVPPVSAGHIVLGHELHDSLGLKVGDKTLLMGREFTVQKCYTMRGNKDDITAWIPLADAQAMLDRSGKISAILALECGCAWADLDKVRKEIEKILPNTQVIERGSEALARAEARRKVGAEAEAAVAREETHRLQLRSEREKLVSILVPLIMLAAGILVAMMALTNVRERRSEIGILRAIGVKSWQILALFMARATIIGFLGGVVGCAAGWFAGIYLATLLEHASIDAVCRPAYLVLALVMAPTLSLAACWIPALLAWREDPAIILQEG